ncbi:hypothetical protein U1839_01815 [Sphingomonas sp. RT2P30]|uniref:hypothetical protein n=1 Tax=Parasphingomonas halimpatiens TaxID=3096162 RepID=UPI002FC83ADE
MSKSIIIAAAISALVIATPALAQDRGKPAGAPSTGFGGRNGSATVLRDAPRRDAAAGIQREIRSSGVLKPLPSSEAGATQGVTKIGAGTLRATGSPRRPREYSPRPKASNNLKRMGMEAH